MSIKTTFIILLFYQVILCQNKQTPQKNDIYNKKIVLGKSIGNIRANMTVEDLKNVYGNQNVKKILYDNHEGEDVFGTEIIFPNKKNNVIILWNDKKRVDIVVIKNKESEWSVLGLKIGSSIFRVEKINESPFIIYGYEVDRYLAGTVYDWKRGRLKNNLGMKFELTKDIEYTEQNLPREKYYSNEEQILNAKPIVSKIFLSFEKEN